MIKILITIFTFILNFLFKKPQRLLCLIHGCDDAFDNLEKICMHCGAKEHKFVVKKKKDNHEKKPEMKLKTFTKDSALNYTIGGEKNKEIEHYGMKFLEIMPPKLSILIKASEARQRIEIYKEHRINDILRSINKTIEDNINCGSYKVKVFIPKQYTNSILAELRSSGYLIKNFGSFKEETMVEFTCEEQKNV